MIIDHAQDLFHYVRYAEQERCKQGKPGADQHQGQKPDLMIMISDNQLSSIINNHNKNMISDDQL